MPTHANLARRKAPKSGSGQLPRVNATGSSSQSTTIHSLNSIRMHRPAADARYDPDEDRRQESLRRNAIRKMPAAALKAVGADKLDLEANLRSTQLFRDLTAIRAQHDVLRHQTTIKAAHITNNIQKLPVGSKKWTNAIAANKRVSADMKNINISEANAEKIRRAEQSHIPNSANMSWVDRHAAVAVAARRADPFMRTLAAGHDLRATHDRAADARQADTTLKHPREWRNIAGEKLAFRSASESDPFAISGEDEFRNQPDPSHGSAPPLPILANPKRNVRGAKQALKSTVGGWGEADISPLAEKRDAMRLLHTHPASHAYPRENPRRSSSAKPMLAPVTSPVDSPFHLSVDHYETAMPISPLPKKKFSRTIMPAYQTGNGKPNSLQQYQTAQLAARSRAEANEQLRQKLHAKIAEAKNRRKGKS